MIKFPAEYDFIIGIDKLKVTSSVLEGALKYYTLPRHIFIYGFYDLLGFSGYLDMKIFGVINPNRYNNDPTGDFGMGVI